ncbi:MULTISPECIES: GntR family transcriptional regulator [unclassified Rhizobium]|uniref:GntR family transcriptional regulator n=1 Tax=unclassified Rhizobium TaxID=2613769 RepID=UPI000EAAA1D0|nr:MULTISPECIES: GntR family transcriptional regulator [unclassified Rhizobium]AYG70878.1 GntR family transcriptional regulator [Rhizobium sp. CCGE531]AYG77193.1 GntR family transcriptional regulator [Rhizobium sp. CCGE532]
MTTANVSTSPMPQADGGVFDEEAHGAGKLNKQDIYLELRRRICLLDYQPGSRLNERELASEFGVSRTPLRTALQRLEYDGLIISQHGNGTAVTSIDLTSMRDIYIVRMRLMDAMAESTPNPVTDDILDSVQDLDRECRNLSGTKDKRAFAEIIMRLHQILHGLSSNGPLRDFNDILFFQSARFWFLLLEKMDFEQQVEDLLDELRMIRRSLELRDVRLVATIHKSHLAIVLSRLDAMEANLLVAEPA